MPSLSKHRCPLQAARAIARRKARSFDKLRTNEVWKFASIIGIGAVVLGAAPSAQVNDATLAGSAFPATLTEFGFFADAGANKPAAGVTPYRLNTPLWSDGADKHRFLYLPPGAKAKANGEGLIDYPVGAALIKTFAFGTRKLETRVLL